jgi:hypothetical protein
LNVVRLNIFTTNIVSNKRWKDQQNIGFYARNIYRKSQDFPESWAKSDPMFAIPNVRDKRCRYTGLIYFEINNGSQAVCLT